MIYQVSGSGGRGVVEVNRGVDYSVEIIEITEGCRALLNRGRMISKRTNLKLNSAETWFDSGTAN